MKDRESKIYKKEEENTERTLDLEKRLAEEGISLEDLIDTALEMYIPHAKLGTKEEVAKKLRKGFKKAFQDINICVLVTAGLYLEEVGKKE